MKVHLIYIIVLICLFQSAIFAQYVQYNQQTENVSPCSKFRTPMIKPNFDNDRFLAIEPDNKTDFKMIIINPCASIASETLSNSFIIDAPEPEILTETKSGIDSQTFRTQTFGIRRNSVTWTYFTNQDLLSKRPVRLFNIPK
jgi:hypothetical protein